MKVLLVILALTGDWEEAFDRADPQTREAKESVDQLTEEISLLNLVDGLSLTKDQMTQIVALSREAVDVRDSTIRRNADRILEYEAVLRELREALVAGGRVAPDLETRVQTCESALNGIKHDYFVTLNGIDGRLRALLTKPQIAVVESYEPRLLPPPGFKGSGRPASETRDIEDHLYTISALPEDRWKPAASALFDLFMTFEETLLGKFSEEKRATEMDRLMALAVKFRAMPDDEFESQTEKIANEVVKPVREFQKKTQEVQNDFMRASGGLTRTGKYLLNPRIVPILEARLKRPPDDGADEAPGRPTLESLGSEPRFEQVAAWLGLDAEQSVKARDAIGGAQIELICMLSAPRDDGRNILREFLGLLMHQQENEAMTLLGGLAPGEEKSYLQRIVEIKADADEKLRNCLSGEQFAQYLDANLDLFKMKRPFARKR